MRKNFAHIWSPHACSFMTRLCFVLRETSAVFLPFLKNVQEPCLMIAACLHSFLAKRLPVVVTKRVK